MPEEQGKYSSSYMDKKRENSKNQILTVFDEYKELLKDKVHPDNQTPAYHKKVQGTLNRLVVAASELDTSNPGEGIFALFTLCLRTNLSLKDKIVEQDVKIRELEREIKKLQNRK